VGLELRIFAGATTTVMSFPTQRFWPQGIVILMTFLTRVDQPWRTTTSYAPFLPPCPHLPGLKQCRSNTWFSRITALPEYTRADGDVCCNARLRAAPANSAQRFAVRREGLIRDGLTTLFSSPHRRVLVGRGSQTFAPLTLSIKVLGRCRR
jgi:hypothetical protein